MPSRSIKLCFVVSLCFLCSTTCNAQWSAPERLEIKNNELVGASGIAAHGENIYMLLSQYVGDVQHITGKDEIFFINYRDSQWTPPINISSTTEWPLSNERIVEDERGALHIVWLEVRHKNPLEHRFPTDIVYSKRLPHGEWSAPKSIYPLPRDVTAVGYGNTSFQLLSDQNNRLHLLALKSDSSGNHLMHFWRMLQPESRWSSPQIIAFPEALPRGTIYLYPYLAEDSQGNLMLAFQNRGMFFSRSDNHGKSWSVPVQIAPRFSSRMPERFKTRLIVDAENRIHAFWTLSPEGQLFGSPIIQHTVSVDDGATWSEPESIEAPDDGVFTGLQPVVDKNGRVFLFTHWKSFAFSEDGKLYQVIWNLDGGWTAPRHLFGMSEIMRSYSVTSSHQHENVYITWRAYDAEGKRRTYYATADLSSLPEVTKGPENSGAGVLKLQHYPNPTSDSTIISYSLPSGAQIRLQIYTLLGQLVDERHLGHQGAGPHRVTYDVSELANGLYVYQLEAGPFQQGNTMVVAH